MTFFGGRSATWMASYWRNAAIRVFTVVLLFAAFVVAPAEDALAYPVNHHVCAVDTDATFEFVAGTPPGEGGTAEPWTTTLKARVREGFAKLEGPKTILGNPAYQITESTGAEWQVYAIKDLVSNTYGYGGKTTCSGATRIIRIDPRRLNGNMLGDNAIRGIAAHEMGHAIGLIHTGYKDSHYNPTYAPTMEAGPLCTPIQSSPVNTQPSHLSVLEDDDYAALLAGISGAANPNPSFEHGAAPGWRKSGGTWGIGTDGPGLGWNYLRHTGYGAYVHNTVRLSDPEYGVTGNLYRSALRVREPAGQSGIVVIEVWRRYVQYPSAAGTDCETDFYSDLKDLNSPNVGSQQPPNYGFTRVASMTWNTNPGQSWAGLQTGPSETMTDDGWDVQVRVYNFTDGDMHLDTVYVQNDW